MKICAISDIHGSLIDIPECDVLCIGGDISPLEHQRNSIEMEEWMLTQFLPWCESLPCKKVIYIAGNHDFYAYRHDWHQFNSDKVVYLQDELYEYEGVKFYGTPHCKVFGLWAFMWEPETLNKYFNNILEDVDILLTHDAPYGVSDIVLEDTPWSDGGHIGNPQLAIAITEKKPRINLHGHLHSTNHNYEMLGNTKVYNVSVKNEKYKVTYNPLILEI